MKQDKPIPEDARVPPESAPADIDGATHDQGAGTADSAPADRIDAAWAEAAGGASAGDAESQDSLGERDLPSGGASAPRPADAVTQDAVEQLQADLAEAEGRVLRAHAELENYRKRANRLLDEERKYAPLPLLRDLLPIVDNLERAIQSAAQDGGAVGLLEGVRMVRQQLTTVLEQHHCQRIEADGAVFDPHLHEAIAPFPTDQAPPGTVVEVTLPGYRLHDRVVRPSQVLVASRPAASADAST